jgi:Sulfotransferase family
MPVIVGVGRSGTTLLRFMLDAHPELAIPPETGFLPHARALRGQEGDHREELHALLTGFHTWRFMGVSSEDLRRELDGMEPFDVADGVRSFYRLYAARYGKARYGDKTPDYTLNIAEIDDLLPEARFIHVIRDGRDVALSVREQAFSPGKDMQTLARYWADRLRTARRQGAQARHYTEVRFEDLVREPEQTLREVCAFIDLPHDPAMARYPVSASQRLRQLGFSADGVGSPLELTAQPPQPSRAFAWRTAMEASERQIFESEAGDLLEELGYEA